MLQLKVKEKLNIHVIGAGGTGGYAISYLARLLAGGDHVIHVYDGDMVEGKNLKRQNFALADLDKNKAVAICESVRKTVHQAPTMVVHDSYITDKDELMVEMISELEADQSLIVVLAVDNVATRRLVNDMVMNDLVQAQIPTIVFDSGNDNQGGQVALYANAPVTWKPPIGDATKGMLQTMLQLFPDIDKIEDTNPGLVQNCAENAESEPQAMMANVRNGEIIASLITKILENHKAPGNLWRSDILTGNTICKFTGFGGTNNEE